MTEVSARGNGDGNFGGGVAGVGDGDADQRVAGLARLQGRPLRWQVGQALVGIDPVGEEPAQIAAQAGLLDELFELAGARFWP